MLALDANLRSALQVVAGINFIFEQLMTPALGDTAYGDGQRLVCGAPGAYEGSVEPTSCPTMPPRRTHSISPAASRRWWPPASRCEDGGTTCPVQYEDCCACWRRGRLPGLTPRP